MLQNLKTVALLLAAPASLQASMSLVGVDIPAPSAESSNFGADNTWPLRDAGDVWKPPQPGTNVLKCGLLNEPTYSEDSRDSMRASQAVRIQGLIHDVGEGGELRFQIKYGPSPEFHRGAGFKLLEDPIFVPKTESDYEWQTTLNLVEPTYTAPATIQVEFVKLEANGETQSYFQCIDMLVTEGSYRYPSDAPPGGIGDPDDLPERPPTEPLVVEEGFTDFHLVLIILICLLILCIIGWFLKYRADQVKEEELDKSALFEPQLEADEQHRPPAERSSEATPEPPAPLESKSESEREPSSGSGDGGNEMGGLQAKESFRHFHFRYVED